MDKEKENEIKRSERKLTAKVYATEAELEQLSNIAAECHVSMADLIRETAVYKKALHIAEIDNKDMNKLRELINKEEVLVKEIAEKVRERDPFGDLADEVEQCEKMQTVIAILYAAIRQAVNAKRNRVSRYVCTMYTRKLKKEENPYEAYEETYEKRTKQFSVVVSDEEMKQLHDRAEDHECSISCLCKKEVLRVYGDGRITVHSDSLDHVVSDVEFQVRFLDVYSKMEIDKVVMDNIVEVITDIKKDLAGVEVFNDVYTVKKDARAAISKKMEKPFGRFF